MTDSLLAYSIDIQRNNQSTAGWLRSYINSNQGFMMGSNEKNCQFALIMPETEVGYEACFASLEEYSTLFTALSKEHSIEILNYLYEQKNDFHLLEVIGKTLGMKADDLQETMDSMVKANLIQEQLIQLPTGNSKMYSIKDYRAYVPFMILARWMCYPKQMFIFNIPERTEPMLKKSAEYD